MNKTSAKTILILSLFLLLIFAITETRPAVESNNELSYYRTSQEDWNENVMALGPSLFLFGIFIIVFFVIYLILRNLKTTNKNLEIAEKSLNLHEETNQLLKEIAEALRKK